MRLHVGKHIMNKTLQNHTATTCGFCGLSTCQNYLMETSRKKGIPHYKIRSQCDYRVEMKRALKFSKRNKCTTKLLMCPSCVGNDILEVQGKYMSIHFHDAHGGIGDDYPEQFGICDAEREEILMSK